MSSNSSFLERVGSKARITGKDGNVQTRFDDNLKSPMIKSFRSREIPLITRKWKEKRRVKIWDQKVRSGTVNELTTEAIMKTAHKLRSSSPNIENFNIELINATILKAKEDKIVQERLNTHGGREIPLESPSLIPIEDNLVQKVSSEDEDNLKNHESAHSVADHEHCDTNTSQNKLAATEMEILVADHIYPGVEWTVESLFRVSNLIAPALRHWNPSSFVDFTKRKRMIAPEILKLYHVPLYPEKSFDHNDSCDYLHEKNTTAADVPDIQEASIQILEASTEATNYSTMSLHPKKELPELSKHSRIIMGQRSIYPENTLPAMKSTNTLNQGLTPYQIQKYMQSKDLRQYSPKRESISMPNVYIEHSATYQTKSAFKQEKIPISKIVAKKNSYDNQLVISKIIDSSGSDGHLRNSSPVESIAHSYVSSNPRASSSISLDRSSVISRKKNNFLPINLGRLGPDKDSDTYREQLEKKSRQLEYAEQIRRSLAEKVRHKKSLSRPSSVSELNKLPQIVINYSAENVSKGLEKRHRMKEYANSIKKPLKVYTKEHLGLPEITKNPSSPLEDLHQMGKDHASSMLEVLNIRRQLNL